LVLQDEHAGSKPARAAPPSPSRGSILLLPPEVIPMRILPMLAVVAALAGLSAASPPAVPFFEGPFFWSQGQPMKFLRSGNDFVCVLTRVSGKFQGSGERVQLSLEQSGWHLGGSSLQHGVGGASYCFRKDQFVSQGTARWNSGNMSRIANSGSQCATGVAETWFGDAATFVSGISGNLAGGGEQVSITQASSGFTPSVLTVKSCQPYVAGFANSFFVGSPNSGKIAQFWGPNGIGSAAAAGEYTVKATSLNQNPVTTVQMAPVAEAMCYLTRVGGKFRGGGEWVEISPQTNAQGVAVWTLRAGSGQADGVWGSSRCYRRVQQ
jgi:hypothetical protein